MSVKALNWAFGIAFEPVKKVILLAMADAADDGGVCWPSYSTIADKATVSKRTAQRHIDEMAKMGVLTIFRRKSKQKKGPLHTSNKYTLNLTFALSDADSGSDSVTPPVQEGVSAESCPPSDRESPPPVTESHHGSDTAVTTVVSPVSPRTVSEPSLNTDTNTNADAPAVVVEPSAVDQSLPEYLAYKVNPIIQMFTRWVDDNHHKSGDKEKLWRKLCQFGLQDHYVRSALNNYWLDNADSIHGKIESQSVRCEDPEEVMNRWLLRVKEFEENLPELAEEASAVISEWRQLNGHMQEVA